MQRWLYFFACVAFAIRPMCSTAEDATTEQHHSTRIVSAEEAGMSAEKLALVAPAMQGIIDEGKAAGAVAIAPAHTSRARIKSVTLRMSSPSGPDESALL